MRRAVKTALAHPTGPVFLSLPVDVLNAERDIDLGASTRVAPRLVGDRHAIDEAAKRVRFVGKAHVAMNEASPELAKGYPIASLDDLERAVTELAALRTKLGA